MCTYVQKVKWLREREREKKNKAEPIIHLTFISSEVDTKVLISQMASLVFFLGTGQILHCENGDTQKSGPFMV